MDLPTVTAISRPRTRADLDLSGPGVAPLAGGTWLFSEPQPHLSRLVDLTALDWAPLTVTDAGLEIAATCTIEQLTRAALPESWTAAPLFGQCAAALLASFKIWKTATVGGNLCLSFPAGAIITLFAALDGEALIWRPDGSEYRTPVTEFVTGAATNVLQPGEVVRSVGLTTRALQARTAFRKVALSPLGRSGVVLAGRVDAEAGFVLTVTAATDRPYVLRLPSVLTTSGLTAALAERIPDTAWHEDAHGAPDWRCHVTYVLAEQIRAELQ
ncbi:MAG TPA: FAD binding domain-containing protein [Aldersonia sp.]